MSKNPTINPDSGTAGIPAAQVRRNRLLLLVLWMVPLGLMVLAGLAYWLQQQGLLEVGSKNRGHLIQPPVQLADIPRRDSADTLASVWSKKWSIVFRGDANCTGACAEDLHLTRQVHVRLDKDANRVQRIYLHDQPALSAELQGVIEADHPYLDVIATASLAQLDAVAADARFILVDPDGWAMMAYDSSHQGEDLLVDLKHLLKFSRARQ